MAAEEKKKLISLILFVCLCLFFSLLKQAWEVKAPSKVFAETPPNVLAALEKKKIYVHLTGAVAKPGVYKVPAQTKLADLLELAGGFLPAADAEKVNLARSLKDGAKINIPWQKIPPNKAATARKNSRKKSLPEGLTVNINTAGAGELTQLPGIGPALAENILAYRSRYGPFLTVDQLQDVKGIGAAKLANLKEYVRLEP